jgi:regulatory protein
MSFSRRPTKGPRGGGWNASAASGAVGESEASEKAVASTRPMGSAKDRALILLGVRWRSRDELRRRLLAAGYEIEEVQTALDDLEGVGLIDDDRFARELVRDRAVRAGAGDRAIRATLRQRGVAGPLAEEALSQAGDERGRALDLARRRASRLRGLPAEAALRRLHGLLVRRGYPPGLAMDAARAAMAEIAEDALPDLSAEDLLVDATEAPEHVPAYPSDPVEDPL